MPKACLKKNTTFSRIFRKTILQKIEKQIAWSKNALWKMKNMTLWRTWPPPTRKEELQMA
jgi:hypothetical protein